jgi:UDP-glucose 4-epimerase
MMSSKSSKIQRILVFGAVGFMGAYLIDKLIKLNYDVTASDIDESNARYFKEHDIPFINIDIVQQTEFLKLNRESFDTVIHLASYQPANVSDKNSDSSNYFKVNAIGTQNILEYCKNNNIGKLICGTSHRNTQGLWGENKPLLESDGRKIKFDTEYTLFSISESAAQDLVEYYSVQHGVKSIIFRFPPVYGYGPHTEIFKEGKPIKTGFQIFIDNAMVCKPLEVWGNSSVGRDIVYIKDVISAFVMAIDNNTACGLYNISSGRKLTLMEEVNTIADVFWAGDNAPIIIEKPELPNYIDTFYYDISKAKKDLGWEPKFDFKEMLYDFMEESGSKKFSHLVEIRQEKLNEYNK